MRVAGVIDLMDGQAVHAVAGDRARYVPIDRFAGEPVPPGEPLPIARHYRDRCGVTDLYCADLDAIRRGAPQDAAVTALGGVGLPVWLDAGVTSADGARRALMRGAARVVVALETLPGFDVLTRCCSTVGSERVAFSLDLRDGHPVRRADAESCDGPPWSLAARAVDAGASAVIVIDLARVGTGAGADVVLLARVRKAVPGVMLLAGGGLRSANDCRRLEDAGCDGVLLATALLDGRMTGSDVGGLTAGPSRGPMAGHQSVTR